jgi:hypothetical protein
MNIKIKTFLATAMALLLFPISVLAVDWGTGVTVDSNGNVGVAVGVGSNGSGAGNVWGSSSSGGWSLSNPYGLPQGSIIGIASNLLFWLLAVFAILGVVGFLVSGIMYLVSTGDDTMITRAKTAMMYSIVGLIVGLSGFLIMQAVSMLLSGASTKF